jgi:hypothetical protein
MKLSKGILSDKFSYFDYGAELPKLISPGKPLKNHYAPGTVFPQDSQTYLPEKQSFIALKI